MGVTQNLPSIEFEEGHDTKSSVQSHSDRFKKRLQMHDQLTEMLIEKGIMPDGWMGSD